MCGSRLGAEVPERRKLATLLFCDTSGSTAMGERVDAESVREMMFHYFNTMREAIERHEGTVEKFIGDAVMAVFGLPVAHEDDALRAVRAAAEMQARLAELNPELERRFGSTIALRIGVNTGEVVAGDATARQTLVTGDAVNVAARLEQAAGPGEVLLGEPTYRLCRDAVTVEPVEPLALKGKSEPLPAYRLLAVVPGAPGHLRRLDVSMVGREMELRLLADAFAEAVQTRSCRLVTVVGEPGVGKSRLAAELLSALAGQATVLQGRCLSYGEGITFWPIGEIVREVAAIHDEHTPTEARERIASLLAGEEQAELVATRVAQAIGLEGGGAAAEEIAWAIRKLFEALARRRPLLLLIDDIHWAEPALLDLLAALPALSREAPILLLCLSRSELLEERPEWEARVRLEPLAEGESGRLLENLLGDSTIVPAVRKRIARAAGGNPLFVEELVAMLVEDGLLRRENGSWLAARELAEITIPTTLGALLGARLDQLGNERAALERGAIEGQVFHRGAVAALSSPDAQAALAPSLATLVAKELVRPAQASFAGEAAFRFRHILIRDAAYQGTPKKLRAELHERFADWLERAAGERVAEYEEILGYHLEQAYRYRQELGPVDEAGRELGRLAAERLASGGRTAFLRRDARASEGLFGRAVELLPEGDRMRLALLPDLADALADRGEFRRAVELLEEAAEGARLRGDEQLTAHVRLRRIAMAAQTAPDSSTEGLLAEAESTVSTFERLADDAGLGEAWSLIGRMRFFLGRAASAEEAYERAVEGARKAGELVIESEALEWWAGAKLYGPAPCREALEFMESLPEAAMQDAQFAALSNACRAQLMAMQGRFDESRALLGRTKQIAEEFGLWFRRAAHTMQGGFIELLAEEPVAAERELRDGFDRLGSLGETGFRSTIGTLLAEALYRQGRDDEAEAIIEEAEAFTQPDDFDPLARSRSIRARILARRGDLDEAERLAREAVGLVAETDYLDNHASMLEALAEVLRATGGLDEAEGALRAALGLYEQKGNIVAVGRTRDRLAELREGAPSP